MSLITKSNMHQVASNTNAAKELITISRPSQTMIVLPFVLAYIVLAAKTTTVSPTAILGLVLCTTLCRVSGRAFNHLADHQYDLKNPRTAGRSLPARRISRAAVICFIVSTAAGYMCSTLIFVAVDGNWLPFELSLPVIAVVYLYSLAKRATFYCHLILGVAIGLAPICTAIAVHQRVDIAAVLLAAALGTWVTGFDLVYSCLDAEVDAGLGVYSMPSRFGVSRTLLVARMCHLLTIVALLSLGATDSSCRFLYFVGVILSGAVLAFQHSHVSTTNLSQIESRFFGLNNAVSLVWFGFLVLEIVF